jgi:hypothetical protein
MFCLLVLFINYNKLSFVIKIQISGIDQAYEEDVFEKYFKKNEPEQCQNHIKQNCSFGALK